MGVPNNKPLAQATSEAPNQYQDIKSIVWDFARRENFAVQEILDSPRGELDFSVRLFRDDISVTINKLKGEPIQIAAFPLCVCEISKRPGIPTAARAAVEGLRASIERERVSRK